MYNEDFGISYFNILLSSDKQNALMILIEKQWHNGKPIRDYLQGLCGFCK